MSDAERYAGLYGSKTSKGQLQGGFFLLGIGALFVLVSLFLFIFAQTQTADRTLYYNLMRGGLTTAPIALGFVLFGVTVALPTRTGLRVASYIGAFFLLVASLLFLVHYPQNFNVASKGGKSDYMIVDVLVGVSGLVLMGASIISSIVGFYLGRTTVVQGEGSGEEEDIYGAGYEIPDWVVERDIEFAMKKYGVSWGADTKDNTIQVNVADTIAGAKIGGLGKARVVQLDAEQVDLGVAGLTKVRPQKGGAIPGEWADEATRALVAFRKQKEANPKQYTPKRGFWQKVGDFFTGRNRGAKPTAAAPAARSPPANGVGGRPNGASAPARRGKTIVIDDEK